MLYQVVTREIREGDVSLIRHLPLLTLYGGWIGKDASEVDFIVLRPVKVPSEEEFIKAMNIPNSLVNRDVVLRGRKTMLRLMGIEPEQQATETD